MRAKCFLSGIGYPHVSFYKDFCPFQKDKIHPMASRAAKAAKTATREPGAPPPPAVTCPGPVTPAPRGWDETGANELHSEGPNQWTGWKPFWRR